MSVAQVRGLRLWRNRSSFKGLSWQCWCLGGRHGCRTRAPALDMLAHREGRWKLQPETPKGPEWLGLQETGELVSSMAEGLRAAGRTQPRPLSCLRTSGAEVLFHFQSLWVRPNGDVPLSFQNFLTLPVSTHCKILFSSKFRPGGERSISGREEGAILMTR